MPSRDQLLRQIREQVHHPATARELIRVLKIPREERTTFKRHLTSLVNDGALVLVRGTRYGGGAETLNVAVKVDQAGRPGQWQSQSQD